MNFLYPFSAQLLLCLFEFLLPTSEWLISLCCYYRSSDNPKKEGKASKSTIQKKKDAGLGRKLLEGSWLLRVNKFRKERKVCAVCLEDFQQDEQVMNLSCSHKYHSACLLPWLASHPHCPYCRTLVEPSYKGLPRLY